MSTQSPRDVSRHSDQLIYYSQYVSDATLVPLRLAQVSVVVVGVGGIGSELIRHLACAGIGKIICIDHDEVQLSNLNRQMWFAPYDVGRDKVDCVYERLTNFAPETKIIPVKAYVCSAKSLYDCINTDTIDGQPPVFVACCADEPIGEVEKACALVAMELHCPVGFSAMSLRRGYWGVASTPPAQLKAIDLFMQARKIARDRGENLLQGSASWTNAVIGAFFAESVLMKLAAIESQSDGLMAFDFDRMTAESTFRFESNDV